MNDTIAGDPLEVPACLELATYPRFTGGRSSNHIDPMPDSYTPAWLTASKTRTRRAWWKQIWIAFLFIVEGGTGQRR